MAAVLGLSRGDQRRAQGTALVNRKPECSGCGQEVQEIAEIYELEVRDLPWLEYDTTVVIELNRVRCPDCGIKAEKAPLLPGKAPFSQRFEDAYPCRFAHPFIEWTR
jgi:transposase